VPGLSGLARELGRKGERGRGLRRKGLAFWQKGFQTIEFKFEFEFQQPKIMHQHECHK
jgi:hypothetical protein